MRNLQINIRNIDIRIIDLTLNTSFGFYLNSILLKTADQNWSELSELPATDSAVYKIAKMENLGLYINDHFEESHSEDNHLCHILEPFSADCQITHLPKAAEDQIKGLVTVDLYDLCLKLNKNQFRFVTKFFEKLEKIRRSSQFNQFKPETEVKENPKLWWIFAYKTVIKQYNIEKKFNLFNRQYIQGTLHF